MFYYSVPSTPLMLKYLKLYHMLPGWIMNILDGFFLKTIETVKIRTCIKQYFQLHVFESIVLKMPFSMFKLIYFSVAFKLNSKHVLCLSCSHTNIYNHHIYQASIFHLFRLSNMFIYAILNFFLYFSWQYFSAK